MPLEFVAVCGEDLLKPLSRPTEPSDAFRARCRDKSFPKQVYACGPKTVPVKRTFLNIAIVGWGGVGWGGMLTFLVLRT